MSNFDKSWPIWQYQVREGEVFDALNDSDRGIALLELAPSLDESGQTIDPQRTVDRFADEAAKLTELIKEKGGEVKLHEVTELVSEPLYSEAQKLHRAISSLVLKEIQPKLTVAARLACSRVFKARSLSEFIPEHTDTYNSLTIYMGSTHPGHEFIAPGSTEAVPLMDLPPRHLLFTRQAQWSLIVPKTSANSGVRHKVEWRPTSTDDLRVTGLGFVS